MPYVDRQRRAKLDQLIEALNYRLDDLGYEPGDFNYVFSRLCGLWFKAEPRYGTIARITGVLENVKQEFYRQVAGGYEDEAIKKNGDLDEYKRKEKWSWRNLIR